MNPKTRTMKTLKAVATALLLFFALLGMACEHCDEEDYRREESENTNVSHFHSDTTSVSDSN